MGDACKLAEGVDNDGERSHFEEVRDGRWLLLVCFQFGRMNLAFVLHDGQIPFTEQGS